MYKQFLEDFYKKDAYLRNQTISDLTRSLKIGRLNNFELAAIGIITEKQLIFQKTNNDGREKHLESFYDLAANLFNTNNTYDKNSYNNLLNINPIEFRLINDLRQSLFVITIPKNISYKEAQIFNNFIDEYRSTLKDICNRLNQDIIYSNILENNCTSDLECLKPLIQQRIDYFLELNKEDNIIGEEFSSNKVLVYK